MAVIDIKVPDIGDFADVPVVGVLVGVGDTVTEEQALIELESDKATMEVPSPHAGIITAITVAEGDSVAEGTRIMAIDVQELDDSSSKTTLSATDNAASAPVSTPMVQASAVNPAEHQDANGSTSTTQGLSKAFASPTIRAFARQLGIDVGSVQGTGRKGRVLRDDVTQAFKALQHSDEREGPALASIGSGIPPIPTIDFSKFGPIDTIKMSRIKKLSGPALHRSWLNIPHVTHQEEADITELDLYRKQMDNQAKEEGYRVTLLSFIVKASVAALKSHWEFNASLHPDGDKLIQKHYYHIGFAADTPDGLVVPVIKDADRKGIVDISKELGALSAQARAGKLKSKDMQGATFTLSSLGGIGGTSFTPIVNAPEVAILGLTRSKLKPEWDASTESFQPRNMLPLSLSYDHRAIDGALAARFAATLKHLLGDVRRLLH